MSGEIKTFTGNFKDNKSDKNIKYDYFGDVPGPDKIDGDSIEEFFFELKDQINDIRPCANPERLERGSIIGYKMVPISMLVDIETPELHTVTEDLTNRIKENFKHFERCRGIINQIQVWDDDLGRWHSQKDKKVL